MDVSPSAAVSAVLRMDQAANAQQVQVAVLKKAMDIQSNAALGLIQALPLAQSGSLGTQINEMA